CTIPTDGRRLPRRVPQRRRFHVSPPHFISSGHLTVIRPHVHLHVRRGKRGGSGASERIDLVVVVDVEDPVGIGGKRRVNRFASKQRTPPFARELLQRFAEPHFVEHLRPRA